MEIVNVTENTRFARVRLGDIRPNRFRNLDRWPLEQEVLDKLKQSITETGFWSNLQAIENEHGEIELRFGHHRLAAGLELFGPDYEVAIEIVEYKGEWNLQRALLMENSIGRNKIMHTHEIVHQLMHWWDDVVFEKYQDWFDYMNGECRAFNFKGPDLELYFGKQNEGGPGNYAQCVKYGIGGEVINKMLAGAENKSDIQEALTALEPTIRRKRGLELKAAEERAAADKARREAEQLKAEQEAARIKAEQEERERQAEIDRLAEEKRKAEVEAERLRKEQEAARRKAEEASEEEERRRAAEHKAKIDAEYLRIAEENKRKEQELEAKRQAESTRKVKVEEDQRERKKQITEKETKARQSEIKATQKEQALDRREWYDARASEVFGSTPAHGAAFRRAVSNEAVRPFLDTENLVPFAQAIKAKYGDDLTSEIIIREVNESFREFRNTLKLHEQRTIANREKDNPMLAVIRLMEKAITDGNRLSGTLADLKKAMDDNNITDIQGPKTGDFKDMLRKLVAHFRFYGA